MIYVGIVSRVLKDKEDFNVTGIGEYYRKAMLKYPNVMPILILPPKDIVYGECRYSEEKELSPFENNKLDKLLDLCDAFIVPGGDHWFSYDEYIIDYALKKDKPILGICLGMQIMAILDNRMHDNADFYTVKIESDIKHQQPGIRYVHKVNIEENSQLYQILKTKTCSVNSRHNYCITKTSTFKVSAYSEDGIIEAIENPNKKFAIGIQWHPELMIDYDDIMKNIFDTFIQVASENKDKELSFNF